MYSLQALFTLSGKNGGLISNTMSFFDSFSKDTTDALGNIGKGSEEATEVLGLIFDDILNKIKRLVRSILVRK